MQRLAKLGIFVVGVERANGGKPGASRYLHAVQSWITQQFFYRKKLHRIQETLWYF